VASAISHAVASLGISACFYKSVIPKHVWLLGAACAVFPDIDVIGFNFGIRYGDFWGHRGFTHSLFFAAVVAAALTAWLRGKVEMSVTAIWIYLFVSTASHGFLDAMTDGGLGVAFFSPFDNHRYFFPWRPIRVSPISVGRFLTTRGLQVIHNEFTWIWIPSFLLVAIAWLTRNFILYSGNKSRAHRDGSELLR
jgi:inner membrane protein